jgi:hypothetical protein
MWVVMRLYTEAELWAEVKGFSCAAEVKIGDDGIAGFLPVFRDRNTACDWANGAEVFFIERSESYKK